MAIPTPPADSEAWLSIADHAGNIIALIVSAVVAAIVAVGGLIWRVSSRLATFAKEQISHGERLKAHDDAHARAGEATQALRVDLAKLPTREDVRELREDMRTQAVATQSQIAVGFEAMARMMARKD